MRKIGLFFILFILGFGGFAQNKKDQIEKLTRQVDSLVQVVNLKNQVIDAKQAQMYAWQKELILVKEKLAAAQNNVQELTVKMDTLRDSVAHVLKQNQAVPVQNAIVNNVPAEGNKKTDSVSVKPVIGEAKDKKKALQTTWAYANLDVYTFRNGDTIPEAKSDAAWLKAGNENKPAWCYYGYDQANQKVYGKLYNWYAITDPRGLAPNGWHIPDVAEWNELTNYFGSDAGKKMKSTSGWSDFKGRTGNGNNTSGFSGLPGGMRYGDGTYNYVGTGGYWWTSTENKAGSAWHRALYGTANNVIKSFSNKQNGLSVRCVKD